MRLMIIGAGGFLGTHVRRQAAASGLEVMTAGRDERPPVSQPDLPAPAGHWKLDLAADSPAAIAAAIAAAAPDVVVNCAGATSGSPAALSAINVGGAYALSAAMCEARPAARLIHLGSAAEYGPGTPGCPLSEAAATRPISLYGVTKLAGTHLIELARSAGLEAVVLRVFNPVGSGAPEGGLPGRLAAQLRAARATGGNGATGNGATGPAGTTGASRAKVVLGPLTGVRDFVDARDVADGVLAAARAPALPHGVVNIGSGCGLPVRALVEGLLAISGADVAVQENAAGSARSVDDSWQQADVALAAADLGWQPCRDLASALTDLWNGVQ